MADGPVGGRDDVASDVEGVIGSDGADRMDDDAFDNGLWGGSGDDTLAGGAGSDLLEGEEGRAQAANMRRPRALKAVVVIRAAAGSGLQPVQRLVSLPKLRRS